MAAGEGQVQVFLEQGQRYPEFVYTKRPDKISSRITGKILALYPPMNIDQQKGDFLYLNDEIIEPLSERELEILALIAEGLSNQQIALKLHLSLSTVKVHSYNTYRKLHVHSRIQAVSKANL
jgi:LuxR family maltose regulon positive regulatory protein